MLYRRVAKLRYLDLLAQTAACGYGFSTDSIFLGDIMANWNPKANEIFLQAIEIGSIAKRLAYLDSNCAEDEGLMAPC